MEPTASEFIETLWRFYDEHGRHDLPWRQPEPDGSFDPYKILVSELMLQQTQVARVIPKFHEFLMQFPTLQSLTASDLAAVLRLWSGLGYNRRAKFLWQTAQMIVNDFGSDFPNELAELIRLPGVGHNTGGAILAYAFDTPALFLETNVRTVYIHHFFNDQTAVPDTVITEQLATTLDREHPREFYWALMDYGSFLKQTVGNVSKFSQGYAKQSSFAGSRRAVRGQVLKLLAARDMSLEQLSQNIADDRLPSVLEDLINEALIKKRGLRFQL